MTTDVAVVGCRRTWRRVAHITLRCPRRSTQRTVVDDSTASRVWDRFFEFVRPKRHNSQSASPTDFRHACDHYTVAISPYYKLVKESTRIDIRFYISCRIANIWNSFPNYVVDVHSVDLFKTRLDKFWRCQDVVFDWKADLTGTWDRSESSVSGA